MRTYYIKKERVETDALYTIATLRQHCVVEHDEDDALLATYARAAVSHLAKVTRREVERHKYTAATYESPGSEIEITFGPVQSIDEVRVDGAVVAPDEYTVVTHGQMASATIRRVDGGNFMGPVSVDFLCGFIGSDVDFSSLYHAELLIVGACYEAREQVVPYALRNNPAFDNLVAPYKRMSL